MMFDGESKMRLTLNMKILGLALVLLVMLTGLGLVSFVAMGQVNETANQATKRLADARLVQEASSRATKQYQSQADLIINRNLKAIAGFDESAKEFQKSLVSIENMAETPAERA
jgi:uncharacterized protein HemX